MQVGAVKDGIHYRGSLPAIAELIGYNPETLRRWNRDKKNHLIKNGFEVFFDIRNVKPKIK
jgi:hypothetical protein